MTRKQLWNTTSASMALMGMFANTAAVAAAPPIHEPPLTLATSTGSLGAQYARDVHGQTKLTLAQKIAVVRQKVKYVFIIFQENRSFDSYFGTYPGANGLFSTYPGANAADPAAIPASQTASFTQNIRNIDGSYSSITPFLSPRTIKDVNALPWRCTPRACTRLIIRTPAISPTCICRMPTNPWR